MSVFCYRLHLITPERLFVSQLYTNVRSMSMHFMKKGEQTFDVFMKLCYTYFIRTHILL
ncbi:protein of unknown function [Petrocella atlantisensis]|uniref:Uncharacterized protein n=1 Tax=Petrocella atlantisensis TaxID=2173034 RepID=A0A3P7NS25_9FIRM|nr:protein of unknown function [Petrocella atlantisensis]